MARHALPAAGQRRVVLHADDFGMNEAVTQGILRAFTQGLLTSASVLANGPDSHSALGTFRTLFADSQRRLLPSAAVRRQLGDDLSPFDLGVHLNLTQGRPLTGSKYPAALLNREGLFPGVWRLFSRLQRGAVQYRPGILAELSAQIQFVRDHGVEVTHVNGHQYIEMLPGIAELIPELLNQHGIRVVRVAQEEHLWRTVLLRGWGCFPFRWLLAHVKRSCAGRCKRIFEGTSAVWANRYFGTMHAGYVDLGLIARFLEATSAEDCVEIGLHPGQIPSRAARLPSAGWADPLSAVRHRELEWLVSPALGELLAAHQCTLSRLRALHHRSQTEAA